VHKRNLSDIIRHVIPFLSIRKTDRGEIFPRFKGDGRVQSAIKEKVEGLLRPGIHLDYRARPVHHSTLPITCHPDSGANEIDS
jgi:hypothetical protein